MHASRGKKKKYWERPRRKSKVRCFGKGRASYGFLGNGRLKDGSVRKLWLGLYENKIEHISFIKTFQSEKSSNNTGRIPQLVEGDPLNEYISSSLKDLEGANTGRRHVSGMGPQPPSLEVEVAPSL